MRPHPIATQNMPERHSERTEREREMERQQLTLEMKMAEDNNSNKIIEQPTALKSLYYSTLLLALQLTRSTVSSSTNLDELEST